MIAGDAAHVHPPQGGQGLNTGVQDAVNLGWKLAQVVKRTSPDDLLDTYHAERHPVGARVQRNSMAQIALSRSDERTAALHDTMTELLSMDEPRRHMAAMIADLDIRYDLGDGHPLLGRRIPDLDLHTAGGPTRRLHPAARRAARAPQPRCTRRVRHCSVVGSSAVGRRHARWRVGAAGDRRGLGARAVLIRPDGHVAWTGDLTDPALPRTIERWFGASAPVP